MIKEEILNRKGARKPSDVPLEILQLLNDGRIETVNLSEWLAVDQRLVFEHVSQELSFSSDLVSIIYEVLEEEKKPSSNTFTRLIGQTLQEESSDPEVIREKLSAYHSDIVRCWAAHMIGGMKVGIIEKLERIKAFAADPHFGVREISFMAVKKDIAEFIEEAIRYLQAWTADGDENIRRFAIEATRPIGVWTNKIDRLKTEPELAIDLLRPLKSDPSKYVRDSVANWLNDASKSRPEWVKEVCNQWEKESKTKETAYIIKRALRTINKK